jgi:predicted transcriptional regulator
VAHKADKVVKPFEIVKRAFDHLDLSSSPRLPTITAKLYFPALESMIFVTMDPRSETVHNLHVSELAYIKDADERIDRHKKKRRGARPAC